MSPKWAAPPAACVTTPATNASSLTTPEATDSDENDSKVQAPALAIITSPPLLMPEDCCTGCLFSEGCPCVWHFDAYKHFDISLQHDFNADGTPPELLFVFMYKTNLEGHKPHSWPCKKTCAGTSNLQSGITQCFECWGENRPGNAMAAHVATIQYTKAAHCVPLLCCTMQRITIHLTLWGMWIIKVM